MPWFRLIATLLLRLAPRSRTQLDKAVLDKERALAAKAQAEERATRLESIRKTAAAFGFGYGLLVVFCYCFVDLKFFPSGMSTGDVLFFLFAALGLGLMSLFCVGLGFSLYLPAAFYESCRRANAGGTAGPGPAGPLPPGDWLFFASPVPVALLAYIAPPFFRLNLDGQAVRVAVLFAVTCALLFTLVHWSIKRNRANGGSIGWFDASAYAIAYLLLAPLVCNFLFNSGPPGRYLLLAIGCAGFAAALGIALLDAPPRPPSAPEAPDKRTQRLMTARILFMLALVPALVVPAVRLAVFAQLGVRSMDTAVSLDKANLALVQAAADAAGITLSACRGEDGAAIVAPVGVLWHATGARSLVQLKDGVDLEVASAGLKLLRGTVERCVDIKEGLLFGSASSTFRSKDKDPQAVVEEELLPQLREIGEKWRIKSVKVIGHADPMPLNGEDNDTLALARAENIKQILKNSTALGLSSAALEPKATSAGSRYPVKQCDTREAVLYQRECNKINRRVEVRFRLESKPDATKAAPAPPPLAPPA